jgi:hypothetical protein
MSTAAGGCAMVQPPGLRRAARDVVVLTRRNLLHTVRLPGVLLVSSIILSVSWAVLDVCHGAVGRCGRAG